MNLSKFIAMLGVMTLMIGANILTLMYGWGLQPRNWWWIIGVGIFGQVILRNLYDEVSKD